MAFGLPRLPVDPDRDTRRAAPAATGSGAGARGAVRGASFHRRARVPAAGLAHQQHAGGAFRVRARRTGYETSFATERRGPLDVNDAALAATALGIPAETFEHTEHADRQDQDASHHMGVALWPGTLGYFLSQMMDPVLNSDQVEAARSWFLGNVRPRGAIPAFRVGSTPYGILPVVSLDNWTRPDEAASRYRRSTHSSSG